ncbi:MAG: helix-hairpin-helix domain-containing protein, partial [Actinomycetota bacterium]|nr:helix-hairpin-helix domain-containing protein [Actinomycetota bacterium]
LAPQADAPPLEEPDPSAWITDLGDDEPEPPAEKPRRGLFRRRRRAEAAASPQALSPEDEWMPEEAFQSEPEPEAVTYADEEPDAGAEAVADEEAVEPQDDETEPDSESQPEAEPELEAEPDAELAPAAPAGGPVPEGALSLSEASFEELRELGFSVTQAKRVIRYREENDGFEDVSELDRVPGFPRAFLTQIRDRVVP